MTKPVSSLSLPDLTDKGLSAVDAKTAILIHQLRKLNTAPQSAPTFAPEVVPTTRSEHYMSFLTGEPFNNARAFSTVASLGEYLRLSHPWLTKGQVNELAWSLWAGHRRTAARLMMMFCKNRG